MKYEQTSINGVYTITPNVFKDERGYFFESFKEGHQPDKLKT